MAGTRREKTPEEIAAAREKKLEQARRHARERRLNLSAEEREKRNAYQREYQRRRRIKERNPGQGGETRLDGDSHGIGFVRALSDQERQRRLQIVDRVLSAMMR